MRPLFSTNDAITFILTVGTEAPRSFVCREGGLPLKFGRADNNDVVCGLSGISASHMEFKVPAIVGEPARLAISDTSTNGVGFTFQPAGPLTRLTKGVDMEVPANIFYLHIPFSVKPSCPTRVFMKVEVMPRKGEVNEVPSPTEIPPPPAVKLQPSQEAAGQPDGVVPKIPLTLAGMRPHCPPPLRLRPNSDHAAYHDGHVPRVVASAERKERNEADDRGRIFADELRNCLADGQDQVLQLRPRQPNVLVPSISSEESQSRRRKRRRRRKTRANSSSIASSDQSVSFKWGRPNKNLLRDRTLSGNPSFKWGSSSPTLSTTYSRRKKQAHRSTKRNDSDRSNRSENRLRKGSNCVLLRPGKREIDKVKVRKMRSKHNSNIIGDEGVSSQTSQCQDVEIPCRRRGASGRADSSEGEKQGNQDERSVSRTKDCPSSPTRSAESSSSDHTLSPQVISKQ